jgi:hypothetical protein
MKMIRREESLKTGLFRLFGAGQKTAGGELFVRGVKAKKGHD